MISSPYIPFFPTTIDYRALFFPTNSGGEFLKGSLQKLGPVFVKVGQTLAQRPDIVGDDVAEILKSLQSKTKPFPDEIACLGYDEM